MITISLMQAKLACYDGNVYYIWFIYLTAKKYRNGVSLKMSKIWIFQNKASNTFRNTREGSKILNFCFMKNVLKIGKSHERKVKDYFICVHFFDFFKIWQIWLKLGSDDILLGKEIFI